MPAVQPAKKAATVEGGGAGGAAWRYWHERVWRSIFPRPLAARTDRERAALTRFTFLLHLRPVLVPARTLPWTHTFGLGGRRWC